MEILYKGKTKNVYDNGDGTYRLKFKDDVTGADGVFDPGANSVGLSIEGSGRAGLRLTSFFYRKIEAAGIPTHFIDADIARSELVVHAAEPFGKGVEVIVRYRAVGSFYRRYGQYCNEGDELNAYVEVTLKDDERNDPLITEEALHALGIMNQEEYEVLANYSRKIGAIVRDELASKGLTLYDIKFEFGRIGADRHIALIDEISGGNMRVFRGDESIEPIALAQILLADEAVK